VIRSGGFGTRRIEGDANTPERPRIDPVGAISPTESTTKPQVIGAEPRKRGDVAEAKRAREPAQQPDPMCFLHEPSDTSLVEMHPQPSAALVRRIQHHPGETRLGERRKIDEIGITIGHEHGDEPDTVRREQLQSLQDLGPTLVREQADLDDVHTGRRDPLGRGVQARGIHRQIARRRREWHAPAEPRDRGLEPLRRPSSERPFVRIFEIEYLGAECERGIRLLEVGHAREQRRPGSGRKRERRTHGRTRARVSWRQLPSPSKRALATHGGAKLVTIRLAGGRIYDPLAGIDGEIRDLWIEGDRIVPAPPAGAAIEVYDVSGCVVMPGGIDMHSHIGGGKVTIARLLMAEEHRTHRQTRGRGLRSGTGEVSPSSFTTGYRYARLGYTAAFEPAMLPANARAAHHEMADIPLLDRGAYVLLGNDDLFLRLLAEGAGDHRIADYVAWTLRATGALAVKIVNPGGIAAFKYGQRRLDPDERAAPYDVTPRAVLVTLADALDRLAVPHPIHVHGCNLGVPGNMESTLATIRAMEGRRIHLTHLQFHSYGTEGPHRFSSGAPRIAELVNACPNVSLDVGQVMFGQTVTASADTMAQFRNAAHAHPRRWVGMDIECEAGCGVVPFRYKDKSFVNALQWAIGLELFLLVEDPWRLALTTDHPNGGAFTRYPELIRLLMDKDFRDAAFNRLPQAARELSILPSIRREYSLFEIAILTRAGPARLLGLEREIGHLRPGARADIAVYRDDPDRQRMFECVHLLFKNGRLVVRDGEVLEPGVAGAVHLVRPAFDPGIEARVRTFFETYRDQRLSSFVLGTDELAEVSEVVEHPCRGSPPAPPLVRLRSGAVVP